MAMVFNLILLGANSGLLTGAPKLHAVSHASLVLSLSELTRVPLRCGLLQGLCLYSELLRVPHYAMVLMGLRSDSCWPR